MPSRTYIDVQRLNELRALKSPKFDLRKLIRLCEEINHSHTSECYFAVAMLTRAVLDHVPPIFDVRTFSEVANNYGGPRSFRESMEHLDRSARKIADAYLHLPVRKQESLPNAVGVDCSRDLDALLAEVARLIRLSE